MSIFKGFLTYLVIYLGLFLLIGCFIHAEAGWMKRVGKWEFVVDEQLEKTEIMFRFFDGVCGSMEELVENFYL